MTRFSEARKVAWAMVMLSPFSRHEDRLSRESKLLRGHVRCTLVGSYRRWAFADGSCLELADGKYRVVS